MTSSATTSASNRVMTTKKDGMCSDGIVHITDKEQYKRYLEKYRCGTLQEFIDTLWYTYGVDVEIDKKLEDNILFSEKYGTN